MADFRKSLPSLQQLELRVQRAYSAGATAAALRDLSLSIADLSGVPPPAGGGVAGIGECVLDWFHLKGVTPTSKWWGSRFGLWLLSGPRSAVSSHRELVESHRELGFRVRACPVVSPPDSGFVQQNTNGFARLLSPLGLGATAALARSAYGAVSAAAASRATGYCSLSW